MLDLGAKVHLETDLGTGSNGGGLGSGLGAGVAAEGVAGHDAVRLGLVTLGAGAHVVGGGDAVDDHLLEEVVGRGGVGHEGGDGDDGGERELHFGGCWVRLVVNESGSVAGRTWTTWSKERMARLARNKWQ